MASDRQAGFRFLHTMLLYHGAKDRGEILAPYLSPDVRHGDVVVVLSAKEGEQSQSLAKQVKRLAKSRPRLVENDWESVASSSDPVSRYFDLLSETKRHFKNKPGHFIEVTDYAHLLYENVEPLVKIESGVNDFEGLDSVLCCYRIEGFCSLDLKDMAQLVGLHSRFISSTSASGIRPMAATYASNRAMRRTSAPSTSARLPNKTR